MLIHIAGVCHDDPKGKNNLKCWLKEISDNHDELPEFVGVEYDKEKFAELKIQRRSLRKKLRLYCPTALPDLLDALSESLAYEPDAVTEVYPNVEHLWLDTGTPGTTNNL